MVLKESFNNYRLTAKVTRSEISHDANLESVVSIQHQCQNDPM